MVGYRYVSGQRVVYRAPHMRRTDPGEEGVVVRDSGGDYVHVRYGNDYGAKATLRKDLSPLWTNQPNTER